MYSEKPHDYLERTNMQARGFNSDAFRVSVSSLPSTSSHGSGGDDGDALGDVYIWGEVIYDNYSRVGVEKNVNSAGTRTNFLLPKPLEANVVLDVHHISCGVRHASLVTRQGEVFTWGEELGGRLGHGVREDVLQPRLVESLAAYCVDFVACGEYHSCAVTLSGELYTWGDGTHYAGLLGHGAEVSHWIPKRITGPLEGLQVASVSCGPWHTALITSTGQLFTFGDGTFGVLGHGDRENVSYPREVESLSGLRTISIACGVWHTAAVVEVIVSQSNSTASGKLFTWGDGDKNRLGQGDREPRFKPTCVPSLIEFNFYKVACGHSLTAGLTTSGHVITMGSTVYGQLGNPAYDGKHPFCLVGDKLHSEVIEEIACGAYHVAVLTSKNEVYTWGKGDNGRLGHGDIEDRKLPTLVEALKDRHVKYITCGSTYTAAICLHKWVSGAEQSQCASCRQAFGFTRKRRNCYNCGLVHCHSCSSRKVFRAALAPNPSKPHRVCDTCFTKLSKVSESGSNRGRSSGPRLSGENKDRLDKAELRLTKSMLPSNMDLIKQLDTKAAKQGKKADTFSLVQASQTPSLLHLKDVILSSSVDIKQTIPRPVVTPTTSISRPVSPFSRKPSPPRSATPVPTTSGLSFSKSVADSLKKTNEHLNQEVLRLRAQVESLNQRCELQDLELRKSKKKTQDAMTLAAEESVKTKAAKEVIKSLTAQLKEMAERLPPGAYNTDKLHQLPNGLNSNGSHFPDANEEHPSRPNATNGSNVASSTGDRAMSNEAQGLLQSPRESYKLDENSHLSNIRDDQLNSKLSSATGGLQSFGSFVSDSDVSEARISESTQDGQNSSRPRSPIPVGNNNNNNQVEAEWIEQYEPGVYITLVALRDGTRDLKRVRFSRRRFGEHQAETWWSENREKVYEKYNVRESDKSSISGQTARRSDGAMSPASSIRSARNER
ncbi:hypothetical protein RND81_01G162400 [Saponaria officinalis]|uniref:Uncharacterized protein n=1 Tax=Saponaria officinalis TaxID=3572 RepID=A0AAW1NAA4_SAPOF